MTNEEKNSIRQNSSTLEELVVLMQNHPDKYQHLRILLRRECDGFIPSFGEEYLVINRDGFAVYSFDDVKYDNGRIIMSLTEIITCKPIVYTIDIHDEKPKCIFIRWQDIKEILFTECLCSDKNYDNLLELID